MPGWSADRYYEVGAAWLASKPALSV